MLRRQRSLSTTTGRLKTSRSPASLWKGMAQPPSLSKPSRASIRWPKKAYRRNSPSVTTSRPADSWRRIASSTARSSICLNWTGERSPRSQRSRASLRLSGRSRLPITSLRSCWAGILGLSLDTFGSPSAAPCRKLAAGDLEHAAFDAEGVLADAFEHAVDGRRHQGRGAHVAEGALGRELLVGAAAAHHLDHPGRDREPDLGRHVLGLVAEHAALLHVGRLPA